MGSNKVGPCHSPRISFVSSTVFEVRELEVRMFKKKRHPSPCFELREYVTGPISFVQIHTTHQGSLVVQAISLVWMELAMFGVAAVVYVASGVLHGYLGLFGDWAYPERWSCPGNMAWMHYKSQLSQEAIWTMKILTICGRTCFTQSCTKRWIP